MSRSRSPVLLIAALLAPALIGLVVFRLYPVALAASDSLFNMVRGQQVFVGLDNYVSLLTDRTFWKSMQVTFWFNLLINPIQIALALGLALLYVQNFKGVTLYRVLFLIPIGVSLPTAVIIWRIMLSQDGLVNGLIGIAGAPAQPWLTSESLALYSIIAIATWKGISYWMIFIIGGLQTIAPEIYDAARIDGVKSWQRLIFITIPLLRPTLLFVLVADVTINFLLFAPIFMLTQGGPADSTNVLMYEAYKSGFIFGDMGRAMAIIVVVVAILLVIVGLQFRLLSNREARS
ncbi:Lactose transport system permease protein LacF [Devosia equisanguinis]|uniref:Lactose transport system permease protein LacF n=1 Tax=Devosia equisanguinis TaxID=2490941 RepID=A0A447ICH5_9HYPH|nr:sugar ABC transporter permease [Devosia equisanguinis]VDS05180.1 Lactose transport system permease protein LacF [Devosia equisanguinis]